MIINCMPTGIMMANFYFAADEKSKEGFIVDPGGYNQNMVDYIAEQGCSVTYIILTHGHGDHMAGVEAFKKEYPDAKVIACEKEKALLANPGENFSPMTGSRISMTADIWVNEGDTLQVGGMTLKFIHTPGHTPGGMCILVDDVLFSGDTLFRHSIGRTDFPGGSFTDIAHSIREKLFVLPDETRVLPGHMDATTIGFEKRDNPFV